MDNTNALPRRTIGELVARYDLEPSLRDLYVEGIQDKTIYDWYLRSTGHDDVAIFEIASIEVDQETLTFHGLGNGNRSRVVALALELDGRFPMVLSHVRCVADSDFDFILESRREGKHLLYTDYTSIDMYTYDRGLLDGFLGCYLAESDIQSLSDSMACILRELFVIWASNEALGWGMRRVPFTRCCTTVGPTVAFDRMEFVTRYLNAASKISERVEFESSCTELMSVRLDDARKGIRSGDYLELLGWYLHHRCGWPSYRREERSILPDLTVRLDAARLSRETLFSQLDEIYQ